MKHCQNRLGVVQKNLSDSRSLSWKLKKKVGQAKQVQKKAVANAQKKRSVHHFLHIQNRHGILFISWSKLDVQDIISIGGFTVPQLSPNLPPNSAPTTTTTLQNVTRVGV